MEIKKMIQENYTLLSIIGEVDALSSLTLDKNIKESFENNTKNLIIDCSKLNYISSAGLGVFMSYIKEIQQNNKQMILFSLTASVYSTFEILGLHHIIQIVESKEMALEKC